MRARLLVLTSLLFACGGPVPNDVPPDAAQPDGPPVSGPDAPLAHTCGNLLVEPGEDCDDGNTDPDDGCSPTCQFECGDGQVTGGELCDTGIAASDKGACP